ncbi:MAG: heat-inducible transcription repressor HrcA, partial [Firmicutes bacterium]|nr:heat-inducible transcription repressor HrcA [Bacillota bacterium]
MELNERKLQILQAIVADFIYSAEPVGSRTISKKYDMGLSPATIRNEMSDLEEMGYLTHPHTSAGRVPSDKAYRLYVDQLMRASELTDERKQAISSKLSDTAAELDRTIEKAASLLSEITNLVSFAITPSGRESKLKYVNLLPVDERTIVLMIVSEDGQISNTPVKLSCGYTEDNLRLMSRVMTHNFMGKTVSDVLTMDIIETIKSDLSALDKLTGAVVPSFMQTLEKMLDVDLYMDGYTNIFSMPEYSDVEKARNFLTILQQKDHITNVLVNRDNGLIITIGDEN